MRVTIGRFASATAVFGLLVAASASASAGIIVVSGDENITDALVGKGVSFDPGDQQFFSNLLGGGTHVLVQGTDTIGIDTPVANTNTYYSSLAGVTSAIQSGPITAASLAGIDLFVSAIPANAFTAGEVSALSSFSAAGGTIFLMGDALNFAPTPDANLNALLTGLGSALQIVPDNLDSGFRQATGSQIATEPLTAGVTTFTYAFVSRVSGGTPLFYTSGGPANGGAPFIETSAVPEPSSLLLTGTAGLMVMAYARRRGGRAAA